MGFGAERAEFETRAPAIRLVFGRNEGAH